MHTHQALDGQVHVFRPADRLLGGPETDELVDVAKRLAALGRLDLLVDLAEVTYINSLALGAFTRLITTCASVKGRAMVCNVTGRVRDLFDVARFHYLFEYHDSEDAALQAFATGRPASG